MGLESRWIITMGLNLRFIAKTVEERTRGLMFQKPLKPNEGALFVFDPPSLGYFWNKNVQFPIDIAFFDSQKRLTNVQYLGANQTQPVFSPGKYSYVVEAPLGWFVRNRVTYGSNLGNIINE